MSASSLKLCDAIEANKNGLLGMRSQRSARIKERDGLNLVIDNLDREIAARDKLQAAMIELQAVFPENETIKFVVPSEYD